MHTIAVKLKNDAPVEYLLSLLKNNELLKGKISIIISDNANEHFHKFTDFNKGLFVSYLLLTTEEAYLIEHFFKMIAVLYGDFIVNPSTNKEYPYYCKNKDICIVLDDINEITKHSIENTRKGLIIFKCKHDNNHLKNTVENTLFKTINNLFIKITNKRLSLLDNILNNIEEDIKSL